MAHAALRVVGVALVLGVISGCNLTLLSIIRSSTPEEANDWLGKYGISLAQDLILMQIIRVMIQAWFIRSLANNRIRSRRCRKIMLLFIDRLVLKSSVILISPLRNLTLRQSISWLFMIDKESIERTSFLDLA